MIIPGVPPSISLNSASNSRQGGQPTSKVTNKYSFDILGLIIICKQFIRQGVYNWFCQQETQADFL